MRATLSRLRERAKLFALHMITQSFGLNVDPRDMDFAWLEPHSVTLVEALIDWLNLEEGHPSEWRRFAEWVRLLDELAVRLSEELCTVTSLTRLMLSVEGHLISLDALDHDDEGDRVSWRRRYLSASERLITLCELRALFHNARAPGWRSATLDQLSSLAFGERVHALHEPLSAQFEARFNVHSALSSRHLFTLESARPSWWRLSLLQLCQRQQIELVRLTVRPGSGWEPLQELARRLLELYTQSGGTPLPEHTLLRCWATPLAPPSEALTWLEELSPRSRWTWLRRAFRLIVSELGVERGVKVCVWIESADRLTPLVSRELVRLLSPTQGQREAPLIMIAQRGPEVKLPRELTELNGLLRSALPQQSLFEWAQLTSRESALATYLCRAELSGDVALEWEALWLLSLTEQVTAHERAGFQGALSAPLLRYRDLVTLIDALWAALYLQLSAGAQEALMGGYWRAQLSDQLEVNLALLAPWRHWFGGVPELGLEGIWAPTERSTTWPSQLIHGSLAEQVERLEPVRRQALRQLVARQATEVSLEQLSLAEACRYRVALGEAQEAERAWGQLSEASLSWWGGGLYRRPEAIEGSLLDQQDVLIRGAEGLTKGELERSEELLAMALSRGERGGGYWRGVRVTFGLLCWVRGAREEASLFLDEVLSKPQDQRWGARLQARASLLKGINTREEGALREASLHVYMALHIARSVGELSLLPYSSAELARLAFQAGEREAGLLLLEESEQASKEQGLESLARRTTVEISLWALHYGDLSRAQRLLSSVPADTRHAQALIERLRRFAVGLHATHERAWGEALSAFAQLAQDDHASASSSPLAIDRDEVGLAQRHLSLEAQLYLGLSLIESEPSTATLVRAQGLARDVRLTRDVAPSLALFARYLELRVVQAQPLASDAKARELRSRLYELREEWGERCALGALTLSEALLYALCGVEVGAAVDSVMEQVTELEPVRGYFTRARREVSALGWDDHLDQRWELQRIRSLLPERGEEASWLGLS